MESNIITLLNMKKNKILRLEEIAKELLVEDIDRFNEAIKKLEEDGIIYRDKKGRYTLLSNTTLKKGKIKITKRKGPIVVFDDKTELEVIYKDHKVLENHDIVLVDISGVSAKVVKILKREYHNFIGEVVKEGKHYQVVTEDHEPIILDDIYPIGTKVLIDGKTLGVKEVLGHKDDLKTREKEILVLNDFPIKFNDEYMEELKEVPNELTKNEIDALKKNGIKDLREVPLVTIDGEETKDFDDAVGKKGNNIYVSIAIPSNYVIEGGSIWNETLKRSISVYPPGSVSPMLHQVISNGIAALIEGEDRLGITSQIKINNDGKVLSYKIVPSIVNNRKKMSYGKVNKLLNDNIIEKGYLEYTDMIEELYNTAMKVKDYMLDNGFLEFTSTEITFIFENNQVINVKAQDHGKAGELIEFLMILNNLVMTDFFIKNNLPFIARNHDNPSTEKLNRWNGLLRKRGYKVDNHKNYTRDDIKKSILTYKNSAERVVLDSVAIRSQSRAKYASYNIGHFALGLSAYATFTSPIRRLPDFINQKIFLDAIKYGNDYTRNKWNILLPKLAELSTSAEKRADNVEKELSRIRASEYMKNYIGYNYDALVSEVSNEYIKVLLPNMVEGKVFISKYEYNLDKDGFGLYGINSNERVLVGDSIRVKLVKVDTYTGDITFNRESTRNIEYTSGKKKIKKR